MFLFSVFPILSACLTLQLGSFILMNLHDIMHEGKCLYLDERMFKTIFGIPNNQWMWMCESERAWESDRTMADSVKW